MEQVRHPLFLLTLPLAAVFSLTYLTVAKAQITPDNSLGAENSVVTPNVEIKGIPSDRIDGGATRGANLFHSFQEFNINAGRGAYFSNPAGIANILTRVTGGNVSNIQGVLGVLGKANLFLINPNGILFGPNARLDVGGSFLGSTANSLLFKNGFEFSATNPQAPPLLTITAPVGLSYRENFKNITNQSQAVDDSGNPVGLTVPEGNSLALVGGNVNLEGGILFARGGRVELGGLSAAGTVGLNGDGSLSFPVGVQRADVSLTNGAEVNVRSGGGGSIAVNARNLEMTGGSFLSAGIGQGLGTVGTQTGDISVNATGAINLNNSDIFNQVRPRANGQGGDVSISANSLRLESGAQIGADTLGAGKGGSLSVDAQDVQLIGTTADGQFPSGLFASTQPNSTGDAGDLTIKTNTLLVRDGAVVSTSTFGAGKGGSLTVDAQDVQIIGRTADGQFSSTLGASAQPNSTGDAGDLTIKTNTLLVRDGAQVFTSTFDVGKGGSLSVDAQDVQLIGTSADGRVPSALGASAQRNSTGDAGELTIKTNTLLVRDGAQVQAATSGKGKGGSLSVDAQDVQLIGRTPDGQFPSGLLASAQRNSTGDAGDLTVKTNTLLVQDGAIVSVASRGTGSAGNMTLNARSIRLNNNASLTADTQSAKVDPNREQATININSQDLIMSRNSIIATNATGENVIGGNININTGILVGFDNSDITANSANSRGGNVKINSRGIFGFQSRNPASPNTSDITATGATDGLSGNVLINVVDIDPTQGLFQLTQTVVDPAQQIALNPCVKGFGSTFTVTGRGGLPSDPNKILSSDNVRVNLIKPVASTVSSTSATQKQPSQKPPVKQIIPAQGWIYNEKGQVVLVGYDPTKTGPQRQQPAPTSNCAATK
ncbi:S-layer family protein [Brasilonema octagenarum UFV-E1]|uniref:S-layer family protein n=1 Tax=Brasilonema sennae CENA114 TaxID=415709 RepID=A0A856MC51_9CYAN|nr:S-layer family protein [Brasilonema sennae]QDL07890.1 S-layer family protein [Brasilonema sennae CENA114]QDL14250.1 S-layer family protein [Brasilonema octagenarum UFV-E1]